MEKIQAFVRMICKVQALSSQEILDMIPAGTLKKIKEKNPHPYFQAYSIIHEGISNPHIIGKTDVPPISWPRKAIQSLKNILLKGIKFFKGKHKPDDNSTENRKFFGKVVANKEMDIDGKLNHIVIGYFPDKTSVSDCDVISHEGEWDFFQYPDKWVADKVATITGLTLAKSSEEEPGFPGAVRLATVQAFSADETGDKNKSKGGFMDLTQVSFPELVQEMKRREVRPRDLFTFEDIKEERNFKKDFEEIETVKKAAADKDKEIETLKKTLDEQGKEKLKLTAKERFQAVVKAMPMSEKQRQYIENVFKAESLPDVSDDGLKKYAEMQLANYEAFAKTHDIKIDLPTQNQGNPPKNENDITTPAGNEYLVED